MARKEYNGFEVVSAVMPSEQGYRAAIAIKGLGAGGAPRFQALLPEQTFKTADDADLAAAQELQRLTGIDAEGEPLWADA
ncbi:hypothetical protein NLO72_05915 [Pseudomonas tremae]|uniref:Uncharacterized protein n=1 Tax=Pseudomonas coronafaciens pv. porri TaxID=83964 RepID=A0ABR5JHH9_9PSED|nr:MULTISPECIES: hypothetical protein [Pseudomonas syringae group]KOP52421.1 hypothetical protein OX90_24005 [Pseudomonas coronafaciens pv. porri]KOP54666.1 hypothetical protein OX88_17215 [Pseudomonas coronafaciens pv. porri]KPB54527.1 Uncharacterized protein AC511_3237 [Pseudomonas coronafaciens pv. oryzae]KPW37535.1 Uncharacterized protein ALO66_03031 [Pseudomonas coronafaciens pv. atropurpurea]KPY05677.1 Uncharacterized protein ALO57_00869 [Pseudomonas coronafaciens pv. oryzae]